MTTISSSPSVGKRSALAGWGRAHLVLATLAFGTGLYLLLPAVLSRATPADAERHARQSLDLGDTPLSSLATADRERLEFAIEDAQLEGFRREQSDLAGGTSLVLASIPLSALGASLVAGRWLVIALVLSLALATLAPAGIYDLFMLAATGPSDRAQDLVVSSRTAGPGHAIVATGGTQFAQTATILADAVVIATGVLGGTTCWATARALRDGLPKKVPTAPPEGPRDGV